MASTDLCSGQDAFQSRLELERVGRSQAVLLLHLAQQSQSLGPTRLHTLRQGWRDGHKDKDGVISKH